MKRATAAATLLAAVGCAGTVRAASTCYGSSADGRLEGGVSLPLSGDNFIAYSRLSRLLDRNFVHDRVATVVLTAYANLARRDPTLAFVYGETGHAEGGPIPPHRTHQNGLSVDFMVPCAMRTAPASRCRHGPGTATATILSSMPTAGSTTPASISRRSPHTYARCTRLRARKASASGR